MQKSQQTRERMSSAATGKPKSGQHRESMSRSHLLRVGRVRQLMQQDPQLTYHQACTLEAQLRRRQNNDK